MTIVNRFSSGLESGNFVVTSDLVDRAWCAVEQQRPINPNAEPSLYNEIIQEGNPTVITFGTPPGSLEGQEGLVSSEAFAYFKFLCNKNNPVFHINEGAIKVFQSYYDDLLLLKNKLVKNSNSKTAPLIIITGKSVGGSVASLFTLWLLEGLNLSKTKPPLCITFGSPLIGDEHLQKCVLEFSIWKSCFLHIVSDQDHTPKIFMSRSTTGAYKPFGTFLLCSASGCVCSEDPDFISEQILTTNSQSTQTQAHDLGFPYGQILEDLKRKALCNVSISIGEEKDPLQVSIITQLLALEAVSQVQCPDTDNLVRKMKKHETKLLIQKKKNSDSDKKLNEMKIYMAYLEWYKKDSKRQNIGYYDMYREKGNQADIKVNEYKKKLMNYWEDSVTEVENKPQLEGAHFRHRCLFAGTNYRGMVEPLHIADYYKDGKKNYQTSDERPKHFTLLEKWHQEKQNQNENKKQEKKQQDSEQTQKQENKPESGPSKSKRETVASSLNDDTCFWARVEEALILLKKESTRNPGQSEVPAEGQEPYSGVTTDDKRKLKEFEDYVWSTLKNYAVSPEIFLKKSSFMKWWNAYKGIAESSSLLLEFMKNGGPSEYEAGRFT